MTLARTALRLLTVEALTGATIAEARVFDSRIGKIDFRDEDDRQAMILVVTDKDEGEPIEDSRGGPPFWRDIDLMVEIAMAAGARANDADEFVVGYPETDDELEGSLDVLEIQIINRLARDPASLSVAWRRLSRITKVESYRQATDDVSIKYATRLITYTCRVKDDCVLVNGPAATGLDVLPEPLKSVSKLLPADSPGLKVCEAIAAKMVPLTVPKLKTVGMTLDPKQPSDAETQPLIEAGVTNLNP